MHLPEKYQRQIILPKFGQTTQQKLAEAKILVIGAGGLGCPALLYLAAAGVGHIAIADPDVVEISNLHRQVLFGFADVGLPKAQIAAQKLALQHPDINFEPLCFGIDNQNALSLFHNYDLILDGSDNFETRYLVNDACFLLKKTLIYGAVHQYEGQVSVFNSLSKMEQLIGPVITATFFRIYPRL
ncbi:MAG TPA: HesA/MoeB/ThiF family protein, partial [Chitinophagales bacterium]|nr:HesA/MoeB/ThiF family protein [Chitinophagales bacterium]